MASLLVTGGAGFIGANFVRFWVQQHPDDRLVVLDSLTYAGNRANLRSVEGRPGFRFVHGDIRDRRLVETLLREDRLDTVVHFAAESHVDRSILGPDAFVEVNVSGTHSLLEAARRVWLEGDTPPETHRFHHVSTDEVYGTLAADDPAFTETTPYAPNSPYAATKAAADHLVRAYHHTYELLTTVSNCSNNYGPYQFPEKLIPLCLVNLLQGEGLPLYGDGLNVRDWLYVEDHCRGLASVLRSGRPGETYNLGGGGERTNLDTMRLLCRLVDEAFAADPNLSARFPAAPAAAGIASETMIRFVTDRPGHDRRYAIDGGKARRELGFEPETSFEAGLRATIDWYLDNEPWWKRSAAAASRGAGERANDS
jgi:dTDP-glucose 4,6-dehydratase